MPPTYDYPNVPLTRFLDDAARDFPDVAATRFRGAEMTYADLLEQVDRLAVALLEGGLRPGNRVAIALSNSPAVLVCAFAALRCGAVVVPVDPDDDAVARVRSCRATVAVCDPEIATGVVEIDGPPLRPRVLATSQEEWSGFMRRGVARLRGIRSRRSDAPIERLVELIEGAEATARQVALDVSEAALVLQDRSGSETVYSHAHLIAASFQARLWVPDTQAGRERVLIGEASADAHTFVVGLLASVLTAATLVMSADSEAAHVLAVIGRERPTLLPAGASLARRLAEEASRTRRDLTSIRVALLGPGDLDDEVLDVLEERSDGRFRRTFGLDGAPFTHASPVYGRSAPRSIGLPVTDTVAVIVDPEDTGRMLKVGETGILAIHGPQVVSERDDGWLVMDALARMDSAGYFHLEGDDGP